MTTKILNHIDLNYTQPYKVVNSRGRVLLEVLSATATIGKNTFGEPCFENVTYLYKGAGCGGNVDLVKLHKTIETIKMDCASAKVIGFLPNPKVEGLAL